MAASNYVFAVTVHTSPEDLEKRLEDSYKKLKYYKREVETVKKRLQVNYFNISALFEFMGRAKAEGALAEQ